MKNNDFGQLLQRLSGVATVVIGFITTIFGFIKLWQGNAGLVTWILIGLGVGLVWSACLYFARFWQPEKRNQTPAGIQPALTSAQEQAQARKVKQRKTVRWLARQGLWLVPLLVVAGYLGWQHLQSLPSKTVTILVADFEGPDPKNYRVTETILTKLRDATADYPDVKIVALGAAVTEQAGSEMAQAKGKDRKAAMVIWGWYGKTADAAPISVNFEVLRPPENLPEFRETASGVVRTFAVAELESFQLQTQLSSEMAYLTLFTLGIAHYAAEDWQNALTRFEAALQNLGTSSASLDASIALFYRGNALIGLERYEEAVAAYEAAFQLQPDYHVTLYNKGVALADLERYEEAIAAYEAVLKIQPDNSSALYNKGVALADLERYEEAIAAYEAVLKIQPDALDALYNKGVALADLERYEEAIAAYEAALKIQPDYLEALNNKGNALANLERYEEATTAYEAALKIQPDYPDALYNTGVKIAH